jgi:tetratricopeptide (TPR) repeat protein
VPVAVVGRQREFALLNAALNNAQSGAAATSVVVSGPAGVGKSTMAVQWARTVAPGFPDGQLFVNLRGFDPHGFPLGRIEALRGFLTALGVSDDDVPNDVEAATGMYRSLLVGRRMLVVLDNARDATQVRQLLPTSDGSLALVTSRHELASLAVTDQARLVSLDLLSAEESEALLEDRLGAERLRVEPGALAEIVARCGGLPLALAVAAARVKARDDLPLAAFAEELRAVGSLEALHLDDPMTDVRTVLSWSVQTLKQETARVFRLLGLHPGPEASIASIMSSAALPARPARAAVADLTRAHLAIQRTGGRMAFHDLIREQARELVEATESAEVRRLATFRLVEHYLHSAFAATRALFSSPLPFTLEAPPAGVIAETFGDPEHASAWLTTEHLVLVRIVELASRTPGLERHAWQLARTLNGSLWDRCQCPDMALMHEAALAAALRTGDVRGQADSRHGLGEASIGLQQYDAGRDQLARAIELFIECGDRIGESDAHCTLGRLLEAAGDFPAALDHTSRALKLYEEIGDRTGQAVALNNIGWLHSCLGNFVESLESCQRSLEIYRAEGDLPGQTYALDSLGRAYNGLGNQLRAIACFAEAAELANGLAQHFNRAQNLLHLGEAYEAIGDSDAARSAWRPALAILESLGHHNAHELRERLAALGPGGAHVPAQVAAR